MNEKNAIIVQLSKISSDINETWDSIKLNDLKAIRDSWEGSLSEDYVEKYKNLDDTIEKINSKLDLIKSAWEKYEATENVEEAIEENVE